MTNLKLERIIRPSVIILLMTPLMFLSITRHCFSQQPLVEYGGIEIGSGGIKSVRITLPPGEDWKISETSITEDKVVALQYAIVNQGFSQDAIKKIDEGTRVLLGREEFKKIDKSRQFIVISSGVVAQSILLKKQKELEQLREQLRSTGVSVDVVTVEQEVEYEFKHLLRFVDEKVKENTLIVDIGSGNTKFGAIVNGKFNVGKIDYGIGDQESVKKFADIFTAKSTDKDTRSATTKTGILQFKESVTSKLRQAIVDSGIDLKMYPKVIVVGGAFFSLFGITQSEELEAVPSTGFLTVKSDSLGKYRNWITSDPGVFDVPENIKDLSVVKVSLKSVAPASRPVALAIIESVFEEFKLNGREGDVRFPKSGHTAWITRYIREKAVANEKSGPAVEKNETLLRFAQIDNEMKGLEERKLDKGHIPPDLAPAVSAAVATALKSKLDDLSKEIKNVDGRVTKVDGKVDSVPEAIQKAVGEKIQEQITELEKSVAKQISDAIGKDFAEKIAKEVTEKVEPKIKTVAEDVAKVDAKLEKLPESLGKSISEKLVESLGEKFGKDLADKIIDALGDDFGKKLAESMEKDFAPRFEEIKKSVGETDKKVEGLSKSLRRTIEETLKASLDDAFNDALAKKVKDSLGKDFVSKIAEEVLEKVDSKFAGLDGKIDAVEVQLKRDVESAKNEILAKLVNLPSNGHGGGGVGGGNGVQSHVRDPQAAWLAFQRGRDAYDHSQHCDALTLFEEAIRHDSKEPLYWYFRSLAELRCGQTLEAQASANRVAEFLNKGASYSDLCKGLERVQGSDRLTIDRYVSNGRIAHRKTPQLKSLTE